VRLELGWAIALVFTLGCGRLGFGLEQARRDAGTLHPSDAGRSFTPDASARDAGGRAAAMGGAGSEPFDAAALDASSRDAGASHGERDAGHFDAGQADAGQADAGPPDAGSRLDGATDAAGSNACPERSDALFCDGFEDPAFSRWSYDIKMNGTLSRSTTRYRTGAGSLQATTGAAGTTNVARYGAEPFGHQKSGEIWLRYYYYLPSTTTVTSGFSSGVVAEIEQPYFGFSLIVRATRVDIGQGNTMYQGTLSFPRDQWTCVELHVQIDQSAGFFEAYLDGALAARSPATNTLPAQGYTSADVGIHYTDTNQGPVEAFVDDVVAARNRVPCD
jgi:hypothetical protein